MVYRLNGMSKSCGEGDDRGDRETGQGFFQIGELFENGNRGHTLTFCLADPGQTKDPFALRKCHGVGRNT